MNIFVPTKRLFEYRLSPKRSSQHFYSLIIFNTLKQLYSMDFSCKNVWAFLQQAFQAL